MRLLRFAAADGPRLGILDPQQQVHDLTALAPGLRDAADWLALPSDERDALAQRAAQGAARTAKGLALLMPLARPGKLVCLGLNYHDHAAEGGHKAPEYPPSSCAPPPRCWPPARRCCARAAATSSTTKPSWRW